MNISAKWKSFSSKTRGGIVIAVIFSVITLMVTVMSSKPQIPQQKTAPEASNLALPGPNGASPESLAADNLTNADQIRKLSEELARQKLRNADLAKMVSEGRGDAGTQSDQVTADLARELQNLRDSVEQLKRSPAASNPESASAPAEQTQARKRMRLIGEAGNSSSSSADGSGEERIDPFLPPGSNFEAVMLNGMDAPTSAVSEKNPEPATLRVKTNAILPGLLSYNLKECFVVIAGHGSLSSERMLARTESISCGREDGRIFVAKIQGYVVGEDGRVGLRGRLVSKQGQVIAQSLAAGVLAGIGMALTPTSTSSLNISPGSTQTYQMPNATTVGEIGLGKGLSTAANSAASFYLELARSMTPVVEIDAGRKVTVMLTQGATLK